MADLSDMKTVTFERQGHTSNCMSYVARGDTVATIVQRVAGDLGINPQGEYFLIDSTGNQITGDPYKAVSDQDTVVLVPQSKGGGR